MPDQPADPIHYEMKIPPEPKSKEESPEGGDSQEQHRGSDEVNAESNNLERTSTTPEDARRKVPGGPAHKS